MKKNYNDKPIKVFISYIAGQKKLFAIDMVCAVLVSVIDLVFPYVSRQSMKTLLPQNLYRTFFIIMLIMALAYVLKGVLYYVITVIGHRMGVLVEADMRKDVFSHMQDLSCSFYDKNRTGALMSHITSDLFEVTELAAAIPAPAAGERYCAITASRRSFPAARRRRQTTAWS